MEACARDFLQPLGVDHWKNNMGARPPGGPSDDQLKALADTANEIGMRTRKIRRAFVAARSHVGPDGARA